MLNYRIFSKSHVQLGFPVNNLLLLFGKTIVKWLFFCFCIHWLSFSFSFLKFLSAIPSYNVLLLHYFSFFFLSSLLMLICTEGIGNWVRMGGHNEEVCGGAGTHVVAQHSRSSFPLQVCIQTVILRPKMQIKCLVVHGLNRICSLPMLIFRTTSLRFQFLFNIFFYMCSWFPLCIYSCFSLIPHRLDLYLMVPTLAIMKRKKHYYKFVYIFLEITKTWWINRKIQNNLFRMGTSEKRANFFILIFWHVPFDYKKLQLLEY